MGFTVATGLDIKIRKDRKTGSSEIEKEHVDGITRRIRNAIDQNPEYVSFIVDFDKIGNIDQRMALSLLKLEKYAMDRNKRFDVKNAYGKVAEMLDGFGVLYSNGYYPPG